MCCLSTLNYATNPDPNADMLPTQDEVEEYIEFVTDYLKNIPPTLQAGFDRVVSDLQRFGPLPGVVTVPGLGSFEIPAPPPPLQVPDQPIPWYQLGFIENEDTRRRVMIAGLAGVGLGIGFGAYGIYKMKTRQRRRSDGSDRHKLRREVVVVLGADTLTGPTLVHALEKKGYVVIASVATPEAVDQVEKQSKGNVKALVLNPKEPASVPYFLRSLQAALSLRFPLNTPGDPYLPSGSSSSSLSTSNVLVSCISLLSISANPTFTPLERLEFSSTYLPLMYEIHVTPLAVIQGLLPHFRIATNRQGAGHRSSPATGATSILVLVPAVASRVGVAFDGARAMAVAGMVKGVEVLRREVGEHVNVVLLDVGVIASSEAEESISSAKDSETELDIIGLTRAWSASEKREYGPAYEAALVHAASSSNTSGLHAKRSKKSQHTRRRPTDIDTLVSTIVPLVHLYRGHVRSLWSPMEILKHFSRTWHRMTLYMRGYRISVGAGSHTYTLASLLPAWLLNSVLHIPARLIGWKDRLSYPSTHPSTHNTTPEREHVSPKDVTNRWTARGGKLPHRLIEGEGIMSTAPASTASGGSRRESVGSFEGINPDTEEDLVHLGDQPSGQHSNTSSLPHLSRTENLGESQLNQSAHSSSALSGSLTGSTMPYSQTQSTASFEVPEEKITDSWVSVRDT